MSRCRAPLCRGEKVLALADGRKVKCGRCHSRGVVSGSPTYCVHRLRIDEVGVYAREGEDVRIMYNMDDCSGPEGAWEAAPRDTRAYEGGHIYASSEEAQKAADRLTAKARESREVREP